MSRRLAWSALAIATAVLSAAAARRALPLTLTEVLGFATGAACVLLVVDESIWNFPVGIANNLFFLALFWRARLFGDMTLQVVYLGLAAAGWWRWARGAGDGAALSVSRSPRGERIGVAVIGGAATVALAAWFVRVGDSSPALDALTTVLSLAAQWLLNRKRLGNWHLWMTADVIYVWLYVSRRLYLTAVLYAVFIGLCVVGLRRWRAVLDAPAGTGALGMAGAA